MATKILSQDIASLEAPLLLADGTASLPGLGFFNNSGMGLYRVSGNVMGLTVDNIKQLEISNTAITAALPLAMGSNKITGLANGSASTDAAAFGQIYAGFQAPVQVTDTTTTTVTSNVYQSTTTTANITPTSASHRVKITVTGCGTSNTNNNYEFISLFRGTTNLGASTGFVQLVSVSGGKLATPVSITYIDSPATLSATTYTVKIYSGDNASQVHWNQFNSTSVIILEEII